jgi:hypothetical protein
MNGSASVEIEVDKDDRRLIDALMLMVLSSSFFVDGCIMFKFKGG